MREPRIEYFQSAKDREWYFRVKAGNGKIVGHGGQHKELDKCLADIAALRKAIRNGLVIEPWQGILKDQWYFTAKAPDGEILAQSEGYTRKGGAQKGIKAFQNIVKNAPVIRAAR